MDAADSGPSVLGWLDELALTPLVDLHDGLDADGRTMLYILLMIAAVAGFAFGRRGARGRGTSRGHGRSGFSSWREYAFQNGGEAAVSHVLLSHFGAPDYHLMNHVTLRMEDGTTQVDHILVSRFGVFVIETKDHTGWIFGSAAQPMWTQVRYRLRSRFQNPIRQNYRHVVAVRALLDFLPSEAIRSLVVFSGGAEFRTEIPPGVVMLDELVEHLAAHRTSVMSLNRLQFCVGRLETARLALSRRTDVQHVQSLALRHGSAG